MFGLDAEEAHPKMLEAIEMIEALTASTEPYTHHGKFWQLENRRLQVRPFQEKPPIGIAGLTGTRNFALCGERGYWPLSVYFTPISIEANPGIPDLLAHGKAMSDAGLAAGRDPEDVRSQWRISREVYVSDDRNTALNEIRAGVHGSYEYLLGLGLGALMKRDAAMADPELTFEWMVENIPWIVGSPEDCVRQIRELDEAVGGFGVLLINSRDWVTSDRWFRSLELFARYVMPAFRGREHQAHRRQLADIALGKVSV
jgi:limonene 1,2-monooxygenase